MNAPSDLDYINFNCWSWNGNNDNALGLTENFNNQWNELEDQFKKAYQLAYTRLKGKIPFSNHSLSHEESHISAWMNVVIETYSSDLNIALSEKTFRSLCLPVPCILYAGKHTIAYLTSLGFDLLQDVVKHRYDSMMENRTAYFGDKMVDFVFDGADAVDSMKQQDFSYLQTRCVEAANNNRTVLETMAENWPKDFAAWWPSVVEKVA